MKKTPSCFVCQGQTRFLFKKHQRDYLVCKTCGFQFVFPFPSNQEIKNFYQKHFWQQKSNRSKKVIGYLGYQREKESFLAYFKSVLKQVKESHQRLSGRVLDIGCGQGLFLKVAQEMGLEVYGVDLSTEAVKKAKKELKVKTIFKKPVEKAAFKTNFFDLVGSFQTIEHLTDPDSFLAEVKRILKPGGLVLLSTPNAGGFQARLMGKSWFSYRHPDHLLFFRFENLSSFLKKHGFVKVKSLKDPARRYELDYLFEISQYYHQIKLINKIIKMVRKIIGPLGRIKVPVPLGSLMIMAQKK